MSIETVNILLVEDDEIDAEAIERAFRKKKIANPIRVARDGFEALDALRLEEEAPGWLPRPYLILLDLNMPRMNGFEFLEHLRRDPLLHDSIVFVLTTSDDDKDKLAAYDKNIAGYLVKRRIGEDFLQMVELLDIFWRLVEFPPERPA